ncbi:MAG: hypothetical protein HWN65_07495 [Candidatus Helarchaeota archaeon]|nr:hypothetical protein [Candidatus Helarchaeota archaeon]
MGLIAGIASRDRSDISDLLYKMTMKLRHRGNSSFSACKKGMNGWEPLICEKPEEILTLKTPFGVVGRHLILDEEEETIPYSDCSRMRFLLLDGRFFNVAGINRKLRKEHGGPLKNSGLILHWIEELQANILNFFEVFGKIYEFIQGMFAGTLFLQENVFIFRDLVGIKPLYLYSGPKYVAFASEKKALWGAGFKQGIQPLRPGRVVRVAEKGFTTHFQAEFKRESIGAGKLNFYGEMLLKLLKDNLKRLVPRNPFYLLLSGGIDSSLLAALLMEMDANFNSLVIGSKKSKDLHAAQQAAESLGLSLETLEFDVQTLERIIPLLIYHLESRDEKKLNIAFPLFHAAEYLHKKNHNVILTGQGADELFGGYERHETQFQKNPNELPDLLWDDIENLYLGNLQRDDAASMASTVELRLPYLTRNLIEQAMQIPPSLKIQPPIRKYVLRDLGKRVGLPKTITQKPKRAIQFSSGSYDTLKKLARRHGFSKDFVLKKGFFSPTQLYLDSLAHLLGFPNTDPKVIKFVETTKIDWPESIQKYENRVNTII